MKIFCLVVLWIDFSAVLHAPDPVSQKEHVLNTSGGPEFSDESSLDENLTFVYGKNLTHKIDLDIATSNLKETNLPCSSKTRIPSSEDRQDAVFDAIPDSESSKIWMDYLDSLDGHGITDPMDYHLHYEVVTTSSKSNLCRIQCIAICGSGRVRMLIFKIFGVSMVPSIPISE